MEGDLSAPSCLRAKGDDSESSARESPVRERLLISETEEGMGAEESSLSVDGISVRGQQEGGGRHRVHCQEGRAISSHSRAREEVTRRCGGGGTNIGNGLGSQPNASPNEIQTLNFHHLYVLCVLPTQAWSFISPEGEEGRP
jgi:hypothetical protein